MRARKLTNKELADLPTQGNKTMNSNGLRKELVKIMPGYKWTVHRKLWPELSYNSATGIQTAGFNRTSTLHVTRREKEDGVEYEVKSSGSGKGSPWLSEHTAGTLARALRGLQDHYKDMASNYSNHYRCLQVGRGKD